MNSYYDYEAMTRENNRLLNERLCHGMQVREAQDGVYARRSYKLLVKLAKLLISAGERIMSRAEHNVPSTFPGAYMQKL